MTVREAGLEKWRGKDGLILVLEGGGLKSKLNMRSNHTQVFLNYDLNGEI